MNQPNIPMINMDSYPNRKCACGSDLFEEGFIVKEIPKLILGNTEPIPILVGMIVCKKCKLPRYAIPVDGMPMAEFLQRFAVVPYKKPELNN